MLSDDIVEISEDELLSLEANEIPESITLEFKRDLNLGDRKEKAEAAKDVSALANTVGGRICYGVDEKDSPDGSPVAGALCPLDDGTLEERLGDVLNATIHPRPRFRSYKVPVSPSGFVLVIEVYPSFGNDLHMVTGFKENRFYRRSEKGTVLMTEPEIREAYGRVAASRIRLEESLERNTKAELELRDKAEHSIIVVPWFGRHNLIDPRVVGRSIGSDISRAELCGDRFRALFQNLSVFSNGFRSFEPKRGSPRDASAYVVFTKEGLVHWSQMDIFESHNETHSVLFAARILTEILLALQVSRYALDRANYWGPVRIINVVRSPTAWNIATDGMRELMFRSPTPIPSGPSEQLIPEVTFRQIGHNLEPVAKEILDQLYHADGMLDCPFFNANGSLKKDEVSRRINSLDLPMPNRPPD